MRHFQIITLITTLIFGLNFHSYSQHKGNKKPPVPTHPTATKTDTSKVTPVSNVKVSPTVNSNLPPSNAQVVYPGALEQTVLGVSSPYQRVLSDNSIYIDERGYSRPTFDIIKKQNGDFALVYAASTENLDIRAKGIMVTLKSDLTQKGQAVILTKHDEDVRDLVANEFTNGTISVAYTCNDSKCVYENGSRDIDITILKYSQLNPDGHVDNREVDGDRTRIELKGMIKPSFSDDISVFYNLRGKGKIALASSYLGSYTMSCELYPLSKVESNYDIHDAPIVHPTIGSVSMIGGSFLISTPSVYKAVDWNLKSKGLVSGRMEKPVWPLLLIDGFCVSNHNGQDCQYDNYPYHRFKDNQLQVGEINRTFVLNDSELGIISHNSSGTYLHTFNSELKRNFDPLKLTGNVKLESMEIEEVDSEHILLFYKTKEEDKQLASRFLLYNWKNNEVLWSDSKESWTEEDTGWDRVYKMERIDDNRFVVVSFVPEDGWYKHQQTLEYRLVTVNLEE